MVIDDPDLDGWRSHRHPPQINRDLGPIDPRAARQIDDRVRDISRFNHARHTARVRRRVGCVGLHTAVLEDVGLHTTGEDGVAADSYNSVSIPVFFARAWLGDWVTLMSVHPARVPRQPEQGVFGRRVRCPGRAPAHRGRRADVDNRAFFRALVGEHVRETRADQVKWPADVDGHAALPGLGGGFGRGHWVNTLASMV